MVGRPRDTNTVVERDKKKLQVGRAKRFMAVISAASPCRVPQNAGEEHDHVGRNGSVLTVGAREAILSSAMTFCSRATRSKG